jgi:hypothetical protein
MKAIASTYSVRSKIVVPIATSALLNLAWVFSASPDSATHVLKKVGFPLTTTFGRRCLCPLRPVNQQYAQQYRAKARNEDDRELFC